MSAKYDTAIEAWERANGMPAPLSVRRRIKQQVYGDAPDAKRVAELRRLIRAQRRDR